MQFISKKYRKNLPSNYYHAFFLETWYSMVHSKSLDSYRVRCMNPVNILRELLELTNGPIAGFNIKYIMHSSLEALEILSGDYILNKHYRDDLKRLSPMLGEMKNNAKNDKNYEELELSISFIRSFYYKLKSIYKSLLISEMNHLLYTQPPGNKAVVMAKIEHVTSRLLSVLVDEGKTINGLYTLLWYIFIENRSGRKRTFKDNYDFLINEITCPAEKWEVVAKIRHLRVFNDSFSLEGFEDMTFSKDTPVNPGDTYGQNPKFWSEEGDSLFVHMSVQASGAKEAGVQAQKNIQLLFDLLRFDLELQNIKIDEVYATYAEDANKIKLFRLTSQVPNPENALDIDLFTNLTKNYFTLIKGATLHEASKKRIQSAFRFYRLGRDNTVIENKYLNWWTALEYLTVRHSLPGEGKKSIIDQVSSALIAPMIINYLKKHLETIKKTLIGLKLVQDNQSFGNMYVEDFHRLDICQFYQLCMNGNFVDYVHRCARDYPALCFKINYLYGNLKDGKSVHLFHQRHEENLLRHIHRIYRLRNQIVHNAEFSFDILLLAANLEYYLKTVLMFVVNCFGNHNEIQELDELFNRLRFTKNEMYNAMENNNYDVIYYVLRNDLV